MLESVEEPCAGRGCIVPPSLINCLHQRSASRQYLRGSNFAAWVTSRIVRSAGSSPVIGSVCNPVRRRRGILHSRTCNLLFAGRRTGLHAVVYCASANPFYLAVDLAMARKGRFALTCVGGGPCPQKRRFAVAAPSKFVDLTMGASHTSRLVERSRGSSLPKHRTRVVSRAADSA
jgi:hypothetical protein